MRSGNWLILRTSRLSKKISLFLLTSIEPINAILSSLRLLTKLSTFRFSISLLTECSLIFSAIKPRNTARKSIKNSSTYSPNFFLCITWCGCLCTSIVSDLASLSGLEKFSSLYKPFRTILVGGQNLPLKTFLTSSLLKWFDWFQ